MDNHDHRLPRPTARPHLAPLATAAADYDIVRRAIAHIRGNWRAQPEIEAIADAAGVTPTELHHLFRRWCGLTPKAFLQALTLDHARDLLRASASVLDTTYEVGLSGPGRLHDLFVTHEAMSPGEWKAGGEGLTITYGFHPSPVRHRAGDGDAARARRPRLRRCRQGEGGARATCARAGRRRRYVEDIAATAPIARRIFDPRCGARTSRCASCMIGTDFEVRVWEKLLRIPMGKRHHLFGHRRRSRHAEGRARGRRRGRQEPDLLRGAVPSRDRQEPATSPAITGA